MEFLNFLSIIQIFLPLLWHGLKIGPFLVQPLLKDELFIDPSNLYQLAAYNYKAIMFLFQNLPHAALQKQRDRRYQLWWVTYKDFCSNHSYCIHL